MFYRNRVKTSSFDKIKGEFAYTDTYLGREFVENGRTYRYFDTEYGRKTSTYVYKVR